jgi:hypothetical protein
MIVVRSFGSDPAPLFPNSERPRRLPVLTVSRAGEPVVLRLLPIRSGDRGFADLCQSIALALGADGTVYVPLHAPDPASRSRVPPPASAWVELETDDSVDRVHSVIERFLDGRPSMRVHVDLSGGLVFGAGVHVPVKALREALPASPRRDGASEGAQ